jgi:hypothetical protein
VVGRVVAARRVVFGIKAGWGARCDKRGFQHVAGGPVPGSEGTWCERLSDRNVFFFAYRALT